MPSAKDLVRSGQLWAPPSAELHNAWTNTAIAQQVPLLGEDSSVPAVRNVDILVAAAEAIPAGTARGYAQPQQIRQIDGDELGLPVFGGDNPTKERWGVPVYGIPANGIAPLTIRGVVWCKTNVVDLNHEYADAENGQIVTQSQPGYAKIRYQPVGTGVQFCVLDLGWQEVPTRDRPNDDTGVSDDALCCLVDALADVNAFETIDRENEVRDCTGCATRGCEYCSGPTPSRRLVNTFAATTRVGQGIIPQGVLQALADQVNDAHTLTQLEEDECVYIYNRTWTVPGAPTVPWAPTGRYELGHSITQTYAADKITLVIEARITTIGTNPAGGWAVGGLTLTKDDLTAPYDCEQTINNDDWTSRIWTPQPGNPNDGGGIDFRFANVTTQNPPAAPPPILRTFETLAEVPAALNYQSGESIRVVNDGANNGTYLATGPLGATATAIRKNQDVFQEAWNEPCEFACSECDGGKMLQAYLTIEGLIDTTEDEFDGWAVKVNGVWTMQHRSGVTLASALDISACNPGMERATINNADATNPTWPQGPFAVQWIADKDTGAVRLKFSAGEAFDGSGPVTTEFEEAAATPFPRTGGLLICGSRYSTWDPLSAANNRFQDWLANGTFTINSV